MQRANIHPDFDKLISREARERRLQQRSKVVWLTGLSGSGKSTIAQALERRLFEEGFFPQVLDGDNIRSGINANLGFSLEDREENIRRIAEVAKLYLHSGVIAIASFISPTRAARDLAKQITGEDDFLEIHVHAPLEVCEKRDVKGLYAKARKGEIADFTGITSPYEAPENPDLKIDTDRHSLEEAVELLYEFLLPQITPQSRAKSGEPAAGQGLFQIKKSSKSYHLNHLKELESESIFVLREVAAQFQNPVMLFSGGKDSILMSYLARKAFYPARIPIPMLHIDTGHNFPETMEYRDWWMKELGVQLYVGSVQEAIDQGKVVEETGYNASRNALQTAVLLESLEKGKFDAALGGGRRDEEKARAKERFFSHRDEFGQWNPKNQRPELWNIFNGRKKMGEHFRVFPISNWTELDVWQYLAMENVPLPSLYFSHERDCFQRDGSWLADSDFIMKKPDEQVVRKIIRFRTIGDMTCTGAVASAAVTVEEIIAEISVSRTTERGTRSDDKRSETAMEDRKKMGYF